MQRNTTGKTATGTVPLVAMPNNGVRAMDGQTPEKKIRPTVDMMVRVLPEKMQAFAERARELKISRAEAIRAFVDAFLDGGIVLHKDERAVRVKAA